MSLKIIKAARLGFCFGVKRAITLAEAELRKSGQLYCIGEPIHNSVEIERLQRLGLIFVDSLKDLPRRRPTEKAKFLVRAHGLPSRSIDAVRNRGYQICDATCPQVLAARRCAQKAQAEGYFVVIAGEKNHPEIQAFLQELEPTQFLLVTTICSLRRSKIPTGQPVAFMAQTTFDIDKFDSLSRRLKKLCPRLCCVETICLATRERQQAVKTLAQKKAVEVVIVIGGQNSANTRRLVQIARRTKKTYHVAHLYDLKPAWFRGVQTVGIAAGASTPEYLINEVHQEIKKLALA